MDPASIKLKLESEARKTEYKKLIEAGAQAMQAAENSSLATNIDVLTDLVERSNELITKGTVEDRVGQSSEVVLDAQVMKLATEMLGATVHKIDNDTFDEDEFAGRLCNFLKMDDNKLEFERLDPIWCPMVKRFRFSGSMYGHMDFSRDPPEQTEQSTQRQRAQRRRMDVGEEKRPKNVQQSGNVAKYSKVDAILEQIKTYYQNNHQRPIPFYQLIIDPNNMMYTFDNSFQMSFLFRDGFITIENGDDGLPAIRPLEKRKDVDPPGEIISDTATLNQKVINEYIQRYNITEPMLKVRRDLNDDD